MNEKRARSRGSRPPPVSDAQSSKAEPSNERDRVALLCARFAADRSTKGVRLGIGDDAAVLDPIAAPLVWTIDTQIEGTHFRLDWLGWNDVGYRSFMAAASDLAAMSALPEFALSALALTDDVDDAALEAIAEGQAEASRVVGAPIVGGNLARSTNETSVTTTLLGSADRPVTRAGARPGDGIYLGGAVGLAAAGLAALLANVEDARIEACVTAWRRPRALVDLGLAMRGVASSAIDISDGLARDASHVSVASDVALVLDEDALTALAPPALVAAAALLQRDVLDLVLHGGEDYALLMTSPSPVEGFTRIGVVEEGPPALVLARPGGARVSADPSGFDHFSSDGDRADQKGR